MRQDYDWKNLISAVANHIVKATTKAAHRWSSEPSCVKPIQFVRSRKRAQTYWYVGTDSGAEEEISVNTINYDSYFCDDQQRAAESCWDSYMHSLKYWGANRQWDVCDVYFDVLASKTIKQYSILLVDHATKSEYKCYAYYFHSVPSSEFMRISDEYKKSGGMQK